MAFLRKRSRSQCSTSSCDDKSIRNQREEIARYSFAMSERSSNTQVTADDFTVHDSCVLRNFPKHKSTHLRFLAWVQYTRQFPDHSITDNERRTCPLLWCRTTFADQDSMLKHVWNCEHLSKGLYWCFQCQKPERVGKFECRRCQGRASRTERIATVAKKMFSALGSRRAVEKSPMEEETRAGLSRISEASEVCASWQSRQQPSYLDPPCISELPNSYVSEMEGSCVAEMSSDFRYSSKEIPTTEFEYPNNPSPRPTRSVLPRLNTSNFDAQKEQKSSDTGFKGLPKPLSDNFVSPLSPNGGFEFGTLDSLEISPTDSEASGNTLFTDSGYSSATIESSWNGSSLDFDLTRPYEPAAEKVGKNQTFSSTEKFIGWHSFDGPSSFARTSNVTQVNTMTSFSVSAVHSASRCDGSAKPKLSEHWTDARSLVNSFKDVLDEHLRHSRSSLKQMATNSIINELLSLSPESIVSIGFGALAGLLEGRKPTSVVPLFAFTHIAYAVTIAVDHSSSNVQSMQWFEDLLLLLDSLPERQRRTYTQIVRVIWQPRATRIADSLTFSDNIGSNTKEKNGLIRACEQFLDIQESFNYKKVAEVPVSQFDFVQAAFAQKVKTHRIIDELIKKSSIEAFIEDVVDVEKRLDNGLITEPRQLELELICAGKIASQSDTAYTRFSDQVTQLFDTLRADDITCKSRTAHRLDTIAMAQQLLQEAEECEENVSDTEADFELEDVPPLDSGYSTLDSTSSGEIQNLVDMFAREADGILNEPHVFGDPFSGPPQQFMMSPPLDFQPTEHLTSFSMPTAPVSFNQSVPSKKQLNIPGNEQELSSKSTSAPSTPSPANKYRCHCGYEPTGSEEWWASNFARHKRTQHGSVTKSYRCSFPGCSANYRRSDNLRAHFKSKGHGDESLTLDDGGGGEMENNGDEVGMRARPSKRRKRGDGGGSRDMGLR